MLYTKLAAAAALVSSDMAQLFFLSKDIHFHFEINC